MYKTVIVVSLTLLFTLLFTGAGYAFYLYHVTSASVDNMNKEYRQDTPQDLQKTSSLRGAQLFLLIGTADRPGEPALADVIMIMSINPKDESTMLFNIPRDTQVDIPGRPHKEKINHAYSYGGADFIQEITEKKLGHSFDFIVEVDMDGFTEVVDAVGGIEVENSFSFSQNNLTNSVTHHFEKGNIRLDGEEALHYVRMRKQDPRGDLGRNERQRQVLSALLKKGTSLKGILHSDDVVTILGERMKTNLTMSDINTLFTDYRASLNYIRTFELEGKNERHQDISYYMVPTEEWTKASLRIENHQAK
ncbi:LCP family glycopolymer transferase [Alteribacillus iranensis]|uniref:Cell envelope-related function transcriptional attenuator common domain-containing protein n=1 Tax=Alteribacillus iranensis TaxID=930128 RepID=A0A1I2CTG4_9BACI|nr:LCP family protein [Alteribacillus iranensis]SFE71611.1 cell envelope-related function transcriptional attenuator common domain-containing protein [Alteribacillus iranensis]